MSNSRAKGLSEEIHTDKTFMEKANAVHEYRFYSSLNKQMKPSAGCRNKACRKVTRIFEADIMNSLEHWGLRPTC